MRGSLPRQAVGLLAALALAPDLGMVGFLAGPRAGVVAYNAGHTYAAPVLLFAAATVAGVPLGVQVSLIWLAHIGLDRALGYGLKYSVARKDTHLDRA